MTYALMLALASLPCLFLIHWLLGRCIGGLSQRGVGLLAVVISITVGAVTHAFCWNFVVSAYGFLVSCGITYSYFHLFNMSLTARRIHLLVRELAYQEGPSSQEPYDAARIIGLRLIRMEQLGILGKTRDRLYVRSRIFLGAARLLEKAHRLFYDESPRSGRLTL